MTPGRRRGRIVAPLIAVLVLTGLTPLASVAWKLIDSNREALTTAHQEYQLLLARSISREIHLQVEGLQDQLVSLAQALGAATDRGGVAASKDIRRILGDVVDDRLVFLRFTDPRGRTIDTRAAETMSPLLAPLFDQALDKVAEMVDGRGRPPDEARLSAPLLLRGSQTRAVLVGSAPVLSRGRFRGVLSALVDLQAVWDTVVEDNRTGHTIFAVDSRGQLFASSDPLQMRSGDRVRTSPIVQRFMSSGNRAMETMPFSVERDGREQRQLGSYNVTDLGWGIFVQAPLEGVYHPVRAMVESTTSWAVVALSFAVLAAIVFAGTLSRPIDRLAAASRAFAAGDFSARVQVRSNNEIGELAETFNKMASELEGYIRRLRRAAEENNELFLGTIRALAQAIDAKDPYTRGHSVRVNKYSVILARYLGLSEQEVREIHVSSLLHDVGKIGIDDAILKKPGVLTPDEFEIMKTHAALGASIMAPIGQMQKMLPGLRHHHERWDGSGYPDGLAQDGIPHMARIIAVADCFDAMTTNRPYQRKMTFAQALARINELKGVGLDSKVVEAFNRAYQSGEFQAEETEAAERQQAPAAL